VGLLAVVANSLQNDMPVLALIIWTAAGLAGLLLSITFSTLRGVSKAVIYSFAVDNKVPATFENQIFGNAKLA
ncbi:MAG: hypothetical protein AAFW66_10780, partial [Pseudomonadota bacterium]